MSGHQEAQRALRSSFEETQALRDQLRLAIDTIPGMVWTALPDGHIDFLNQRWQDYTGLSLEEASGWRWQAAVHPTDLPGLVSYWRSALVDGKPDETEARLRRFDGEYRWFLHRCVPLYDELGTLVKWYGQTTDIDDRKRAETLLAGEKRILEMIARGNHSAVILEALCHLVEEMISGSFCSILTLDEASQRLWHVAAPSLPKSYTQAVDGQSVHPALGPCGNAAYRGEQVIISDASAQTSWPEYRELALANRLRACWSTPILSQERKVLGVFTVHSSAPARPSPYQLNLIEQLRDVASIAMERGQAEEALRRSEAYLSEAQRLSHTGSFYWNPASGQLIWSHETYRIYDLDPAIKPSLEIARQRIHPDDIALFQRVAERASTQGTDFAFEHRLQMPDGSIKYLQIVAHPVRIGPDNLLEFIGAVRDVTEQKLSEDALHQARAELAHVARVTTLGQLTASIAHEVNQPLAGIMTNANACLRLLAQSPPDIAGANETAKRSIRDATRAADVIARLRALFQKQKATREPFDLNEAIKEVIALTRRELQRGRAMLRTELATRIPFVDGDRVQIQQVLLNLILNALDAMSGVEDRARELVIATALQEDEICVTVQDSGIGLEPQDQERIFDAFYSTKSGGMGMGLSISRFIVESHRGRLWAVPNVGPGATFHFSLPRTEECG